MNLIALTEERAPVGVRGTFRLPIKAAGIKSGAIFLNTELDYRDRRNISAALDPKIINALTKEYGASPDSYFLGKTIEITGEANRMRINFSSNSRVTSLKQIRVSG
jgi:hypothetical protein